MFPLIGTRYRIWCEDVPFDEVVRPSVLAPLAARGIALLAGVRPWTERDAGPLVAACRDAGVCVGLWPMLGDADGRWANAQNVDRFARFTRDLTERLVLDDLAPDEIVLDLEPPIWTVRRWVERLRPLPFVPSTRASASTLESAVEQFRALVTELGRTGVGVSAAAVPLVLADDEAHGGHGGWQRLLGTPIDGVGFGRVDVMLYTSLFEGYSRGVVGRSTACALLHALAQRTRARFGARGAVAVGAVSTGALGHEPVYRSVQELRDDVSLARSAGIDSLSLFDLGGVLRRSPIEPWLDAFVETPAGLVPARRSLRSRTAWWLVERVGALAPARR